MEEAGPRLGWRRTRVAATSRDEPGRQKNQHPLRDIAAPHWSMIPARTELALPGFREESAKPAAQAQEGPLDGQVRGLGEQQ